MNELVDELNKIKQQFLYHKAIVGYIDPKFTEANGNLRYCSGGYYKTKACVVICKNGLTREDHNEASHSINHWFIVYCAALIQDKMGTIPGFSKVKKTETIPLKDFTCCQLLYILRDKLAHGVYRKNKIGKDFPEPYSAINIANEIYKRFNFDRTHKDNDSFSLPVDTVVIRLVDTCIEEIKESMRRK